MLSTPRVSLLLVPFLLVHVAQAVPRNYAAWRTPDPIQIDGNIYKKVWEEVPWSEDFVEIRGADAPATAAMPSQDTRTRVKMRWDDKYLYVVAEMTAQDWVINADFTNRNEPIYQKDSDIEIFLDTDGSNANYKEMELNAKNTVWNLLLDKPYAAGGGEHSGREHRPGDADYWDVNGQKTATKVYGETGKKSPFGKWVAEIALAHDDSMDRTNAEAPAAGQFWRIGFSRVEKKGDINWVWTPQMIWSPASGKYVGQVNMHAPDAWGYVVFTEKGGPAGPQQDWVDPKWKIKALAHQIYYAEKYALSKEGATAGAGKLLSPEALAQRGWINSTLWDGYKASVTDEQQGRWTVHVEDNTGCVSTIQQDNIHFFECTANIFGVHMPPTRYIFGYGLAGISGAAMAAFWMSRNKKVDGSLD